jgi:hypothetical protein
MSSVEKLVHVVGNADGWVIYAVCAVVIILGLVVLFLAAAGCGPRR